VYCVLTIQYLYTGQSREASSDIAMAMSFLRRTYPNQLANYSGNDLPDALDLITAGLTTRTPGDGQHQLNHRHHHHHHRRRHWKELDLEAYCRQQLMTAGHDSDESSPVLQRGTQLTEFWRKRRKTDRRRRRHLLPRDRSEIYFRRL